MDLGANVSLYTMLMEATFVVKAVLLILVLMSLLSWAIIFYKIFLLNKTKKDILEDMGKFSKASDFVNALRTLRKKPSSSLYNIGSKAVNEIKALEKSNLAGQSAVGVENIRRVLRQAVSTEVNKLGYALSFLATCANSAPFLGLFGTVWGIMHTFQSIGMQESTALSAVAPGIAEALVATAFGLAVAIPASIAYNSFLSVLESIESELVNYAGDFLNRAQRELPWLNPSNKSVEIREDKKEASGQL
mgnify:CR=1 FL=1